MQKRKKKIERMFSCKIVTKKLTYDSIIAFWLLDYTCGGGMRNELNIISLKFSLVKDENGGTLSLTIFQIALQFLHLSSWLYAI